MRSPSEYDAIIFQEDLYNFSRFASKLQGLGVSPRLVRDRRCQNVSIAEIGRRTATALNFTRPTHTFKGGYLEMRDSATDRTYRLHLGNAHFLMNCRAPLQRCPGEPALPPLDQLRPTPLPSSPNTVCSSAARAPCLTSRYHSTQRCRVTDNVTALCPRQG